MSAPSPPPPRVSACPAAHELERWLEMGEPLAPIASHVAVCPSCAGTAAELRDNLRFMDRFVAQLGDEPLAARAPAFDPDLLPGYRLVREIARGGQGTVYEGVQIQTKRRVAVKMIPAGEGGTRAQRRLQREAEIVAALRHPGIVTIYASGILPDGRCALAMEYVDGARLDEWGGALDVRTPATREDQRAALELKLRTFTQICDAVQHAHHAGVIHRDLKPANILVSADGVPRVLDFGIARRVVAETGITRAGGFAGTLAYASPEQVSGVPDSVDTRSDVYALGLILYELLTGRKPYDTDGSLTGTIANITRAEPAPMRAVQPGEQPAGADLEAIVRKALAKDREMRYQTAGALKADIDNYLGGRAVDARSHSGWYALRKAAKRHRGAVALIAASILVISAFAVYMAWSAARLDRQATLLSEALASSTLERARLLGANGANERATALIWPELRRSGADIDDPGLGFTGSPEANQAAWALFEVLSRHPVVMKQPTAPDAVTVGFEDGSDAVRLLNPDGTSEVRAMPDGRLISRDRLTSPFTGRTAFDAPQSPRFALLATSTGLRWIDLVTKAERSLDHPILAAQERFSLARGGERFLTVSTDKVLRLWQVEPLKLISEIATGVTLTMMPRFTPDGRYVTSSAGDQAGMWSAADGTRKASFMLPPDLTSRAVTPVLNHACLSPDGKTLAVSLSTWILLYDPAEPSAPPRRIAAHSGFVNYLDFSADSSTLLSFGFERTSKTWNTATGELISAFEHDVGWHGWPALSPDGRYLALCGNDNMLRVFENRPRAWLTRLRGAANTVHTVRTSPDGSLLASTAADGSVRVWRLPALELLWSSPPDANPLPTLAFTPDGARLIAARRDGVVRQWDALRGGEPTVYLKGPPSLSTMGFSPDGRLFAIGTFEGEVMLYSAATTTPLGVMAGHGSRVAKFAFSPDGACLATASADKRCIVWRVSDQSMLLELTGHTAGLRAVTYSPDGSVIATGSDDLTIRLWDARTGACMRTITGLKQHVFGLVFHPAGHVLISACRDPSLQVWDVRTGRELAVLDGHGEMVLSVALGLDGQTLFTGSADATVGVWNLAYYQQHVRNSR